LDCYGGLDLNLKEIFQQANDRRISFLGWDDFNETRYEKYMGIIMDKKYSGALDTIFTRAKQHIVAKIGTTNFCQRIEFKHYEFKFYKKHKPKRSSGEIVFKFHYQPITCWSGNGIRLVFRFEELENGKFDITYPTYLPRCSEEECDFNVLSSAAIGAKALELELIDGTESLSTERYDPSTIALQKIENLYRQQHYYESRTIRI